MSTGDAPDEKAAPASTKTPDWSLRALFPVLIPALLLGVLCLLLLLMNR